MSLPKQAQALAEEAERLEKELLEVATPSEPTPTTDEPASEQPAELPVADPLETPTVTESEPEEEPEKPSEDETWERRYKTLQGMYNADVPRLRSEVSELTNKLNAAVARLESKAADPISDPDQRLVTDKDVEDFGSDLVDLIKRQATDVANAQIGRLEEENARLREQLTGVADRQGDIARQTYFSDLARQVPDYEQINISPQFLEWLAEVDPMSGFSRQEYLNTAFNNYDVARTAMLFDSFKQLTAPTPQPKAVPKELQRQVAPGTSKASGNVTADANEKIWSMSEIDRFYKDVARGSYRGNDAEQARIEAEIDLAVQQGRLSQ